MTPIYGLLLVALLTLILYATWRPSSGRRRRAQKSRMGSASAQSATPAATRPDLTPLDYPIDTPGRPASARRRPGVTYNRKGGH
jgi:hypothetical protein